MAAAKTGEKAHQKEIKAMEAHVPATSGCVVRCESEYVDGNPHSHRWQASKQAISEPDVYAMDMAPWPIVGWGMKKLSGLQAHGGLVSNIGQDAQGRNTAVLKPFARMFIPFPHNAHHIIPMSVLWTYVIDKVVAKAAPNTLDMFKLVIGGLLTEPYNINDQPNMIVLPTLVKESLQFGLPVHTDGTPDHADYSRHIAARVKLKIPFKYDALANAVKKKAHQVETPTTEVKDALVTISTTTYKIIMRIARSKKRSGETLDSLAETIGSQVARRLPKGLSRG